MKKTALLAASLLAGFAASAQIAITSSTLTYTQDFNTLSMDTSSFSNAMPAGWSLGETGTGSANDGMYRVNDGSKNNGDTYSYGTIASTDRALGGLASGSLIPMFGAMFTNNTGATITGFSLSYTGEQWRLGNATAHTDSLVFHYSTGATSVVDSSASASWTEVPELMLNSVVTTGTVGALDGNNPANQTTVTGTVIFATPVPNGASFFVRWKDLNVAGADDGLAIDDATFTFVTGTGTGISTVNNTASNLTVIGVPANGNINLGFTLQNAGPLHIQVLDLNGRVVRSENINAQSGAQQYQISNLNAPAGIYVIRINNGKETSAVKATLR